MKNIAVMLGLALVCSLYASKQQIGAQNTQYTQAASQCVQVRNVPYGYGVPGGVRRAYNTCNVDVTMVVSNPSGRFAPGRVSPGQWFGAGTMSQPYRIWACTSPGTPWDSSINDWPGYNSQSFTCPVQ